MYQTNVSVTVDTLESRIAGRIKTEREARGWSLAELAKRSGVSKAMISKVERGEASPTASLLGRLSGAFGLTLSVLMARAEQAASRLAREADQPIWRDPATGFMRTAVSPDDAGSVNLVRCELPAGASIVYPASAFAFIRNQIWVLAGTLHFTEGAETHELKCGDCLELGSPADCRYENRSQDSCVYLVAVARQR